MMGGRLRRVGVLLLLVAAAGCAAPPADDLTGWPDEALAASAKAHFRAGRFGLAAEQFQALAAREPGSVEALNGLAASYDRIGRYDLARRAYRKALRLAPNSAQTLNNIGYSAYLQRRPEIALAFYEAALRAAGEGPLIANNIRMVERLLREARLGPCGAVAPASPPPEPRPVRDRVRLEQVGLATERLLTRPASPQGPDSGALERARRLLTPPAACRSQKRLEDGGAAAPAGVPAARAKEIE